MSLREGGGLRRAVRRTAGYKRDCYTTIGRSGRHFCYYTSTEVNKSVSSESSEGMYCENAFRTGRRNSSFPKKCLCVRMCRLPFWDNLLVCGLNGLYQAGHITGIRTICNEYFTVLSVLRVDYCSEEQNYL